MYTTPANTKKYTQYVLSYHTIFANVTYKLETSKIQIVKYLLKFGLMKTIAYRISPQLNIQEISVSTTFRIVPITMHQKNFLFVDGLILAFFHLIFILFCWCWLCGEVYAFDHEKDMGYTPCEAVSIYKLLALVTYCLQQWVSFPECIQAEENYSGNPE